MSTERNYDVIPSEGVPIKAWTRGVTIEDEAAQQLRNVARLPFIHRWVAAMPDVHWGIGATVGSVIPTVGAVIPAAAGVDIGCGMMATQTSLTANDLPESLREVGATVRRTDVTSGSTGQGGRGPRCRTGTTSFHPLRAVRRQRTGAARRARPPARATSVGRDEEVSRDLVRQVEHDLGPLARDGEP